MRNQQEHLDNDDEKKNKVNVSNNSNCSCNSNRTRYHNNGKARGLISFLAPQEQERQFLHYHPQLSMDTCEHHVDSSLVQSSSKDTNNDTVSVSTSPIYNHQNAEFTLLYFCDFYCRNSLRFAKYHLSPFLKHLNSIHMNHMHHSIVHQDHITNMSMSHEHEHEHEHEMEQLNQNNQQSKNIDPSKYVPVSACQLICIPNDEHVFQNPTSLHPDNHNQTNSDSNNIHTLINSNNNNTTSSSVNTCTCQQNNVQTQVPIINYTVSELYTHLASNTHFWHLGYDHPHRLPIIRLTSTYAVPTLVVLHNPTGRIITTDGMAVLQQFNNHHYHYDYCHSYSPLQEIYSALFQEWRKGNSGLSFFHRVTYFLSSCTIM